VTTPLSLLVAGTTTSIQCPWSLQKLDVTVDSQLSNVGRLTEYAATVNASSM